MKTSTKFATLAFGTASLITLAVPPALAQVVGGSNCSTIREMDKNQQCLTRADGAQDKEGDILRDGQTRIKTYTGSGFNKNGHPFEVNTYADGGRDYRNTDPKTGITTYKVYSPNGTLSTLTSKRSAN
jgi:hypothetical protein